MPEDFTVIYDGVAFENGQMDVRDLAPALLAASDLVMSAARLMAPESEPPGVAIKGAENGSFQIFLQIHEPGVLERIFDVLNSRQTTAMLNLEELGACVVGAVAFLAHLRHKRIKSIEPSPVRPGWARITLDDGTSLEVRREAITLSTDLQFRKGAKGLVEPLERQGVEEVQIVSREERAIVHKRDLPGFAIPDEEREELLDNTREAVLHLVSVAFRAGNKWRVSEGDAVFWVDIADEAFSERVEANVEAFRAGDALKVELRTQQWNGVDGVTTDRTILQVHEHVPGYRRVQLPFTDDATDTSAN